MTGALHGVIIIVNWNGKADTLACLASLFEARVSSWKTIVVDNGSTDGSISAIRSSFPQVEIIETGANLGFTGGNNLAIQRAIADEMEFVLLLNNDTVVAPSFLDDLLAAADQYPSFGILTPLIYYFDRQNEPWFAGSTIDLGRGLAFHDNYQSSNPPQDIKTIPWATGCAMLIRRDLLKQLDGFDNRFFLNWEDVDLSVRATQIGWKIGLVPAAKIWHKVGRSFALSGGIGNYYHVRNHLLFLSLHAHDPSAALARATARHLRHALGRIARREKECFKSALGTTRAITDFIRNRFGPLDQSNSGNYSL